MSTRKPISGKALKGFRHDVAKLKRAGLVSAKVDARSQKPTRHMREKVDKFRGVLEGTEKPVKASSRKQARALGELFGSRDRNMSSGRTVAIPTGKTGKARVVKRPGQDDKVYVYDTENGHQVRKEYVSGARENVRGLPVGRNIRYRVNFRSGFYAQSDSLEDLAQIMFPYEQGDPKHKPWGDWRRYIEIVRIKSDDRDDWEDGLFREED